MGDRVVVLPLAAADATGRMIRIPVDSVLLNCVLSRQEREVEQPTQFGPYIVSFEYDDTTWYLPLYAFQARTSSVVGSST